MSRTIERTQQALLNESNNPPSGHFISPVQMKDALLAHATEIKADTRSVINQLKSDIFDTITRAKDSVMNPEVTLSDPISSSSSSPSPDTSPEPLIRSDSSSTNCSFISDDASLKNKVGRVANMSGWSKGALRKMGAVDEEEKLKVNVESPEKVTMADLRTSLGSVSQELTLEPMLTPSTSGMNRFKSLASGVKRHAEDHVEVTGVFWPHHTIKRSNKGVDYDELTLNEFVLGFLGCISEMCKNMETWRIMIHILELILRDALLGDWDLT